MNIWQVIPSEADIRLGTLVGPLFEAPCVLGKNGVIAASGGREGDGKSPAGTYPFRRVYYRPDREEEPVTCLPCTAISTDMGWCDASEDGRYNTLVSLPYGGGHEKMWRHDSLYDLVIVIGHNDEPVVPGLGSAIFIHVARDDFGPTAGCVALKAPALRQLLRLAKPDDQIKVELLSCNRVHQK
ncbi:MAG: hypothetical protein COB37_03895 [Kordiimonadales bacterium]|nr:MAG: hypothetical protein COB37_03895 [Kordiimonadales bacterium]